jgi:hypothetical protein
LEGEVVRDPRGDEVVVFKEFFLARLRFPPHPLVVGVFQISSVESLQLCKLGIYVWGCKSQGVEPDLEGFI